MLKEEWNWTKILSQIFLWSTNVLLNPISISASLISSVWTMSLHVTWKLKWKTGIYSMCGNANIADWQLYTVKRKIFALPYFRPLMKNFEFAQLHYRLYILYENVYSPTAKWSKWAKLKQGRIKPVLHYCKIQNLSRSLFHHLMNSNRLNLSCSNLSYNKIIKSILSLDVINVSPMMSYGYKNQHSLSGHFFVKNWRQ